MVYTQTLRDKNANFIKVPFSSPYLGLFAGNGNSFGKRDGKTNLFMYEGAHESQEGSFFSETRGITRTKAWRQEQENMGAEKTVRTCKKGHQFYKSSDCPVCPVCEAGKKPQDGFLSLLSAPARRALENHAIQTIEQLSHYSEKEILKLHGLGKSSMPILRAALAAEGLDFKK